MLGTRFTSVVETTFLRPFTCSRCSVESVARVRARGEGDVTAWWLSTEQAKGEARLEATQAAEEAADQLASLGTCPVCGARNLASLIKLKAGAWSTGLMLGLVLALLCFFFFSQPEVKTLMMGGTFVGSVAWRVITRSWLWLEHAQRVTVIPAKL